MNLDKIAEDHVGAYIYAERYVNFIEPFTKKLRGDLAQKYSSFDGNQKMQIKYVMLPIDSVETSKSSALAKSLEAQFIKNDGPAYVQFPIHPQLVEENDCLADELLKSSMGRRSVDVQPTSSMRTFFSPSEMCYLKTSFPKRISSSNRAISNIDIKQGLWITARLQQLADEGVVPQSLAFMPDVLAMRAENGLGAIIRDAKIIHAGMEGCVFPAAALFAPDKYNPTDPLLIEQLAEINNQTVEDYTLNTIINEQLKSWFWLIDKAGIVFSPHGQNMLIEFDKDFYYKRTIHRDFQERKVIAPVLEKQKVELPDCAISKENFLATPAHLSLTYDFIIGNIFYDRAFKELSNRGHDATKLVAGTKTLFHSLAKNSQAIFNPTRVKYVVESGIRKIIDTHEKPIYR